MIFLNGNIDVVTRILEFVAESSEDLNTCAMISRVFRLSRSDPRFEQTRTGTIILKTSVENIPTEVWQRWDQQVFTGNRVRLVAILTQLPGYGTRSNFRVSSVSSFKLMNVREVILERDSYYGQHQEEMDVIMAVRRQLNSSKRSCRTSIF
jgi:hypothetical protein